MISCFAPVGRQLIHQPQFTKPEMIDFIFQIIYSKCYLLYIFTTIVYKTFTPDLSTFRKHTFHDNEMCKIATILQRKGGKKWKSSLIDVTAMRIDILECMHALGWGWGQPAARSAPKDASIHAREASSHVTGCSLLKCEQNLMLNSADAPGQYKTTVNTTEDCQVRLLLSSVRSTS